MEELDEFGIPIKKQTSKVTLDEFGIPIKKKEQSVSTSTPQKSVSGTPTGSSGGVNPSIRSFDGFSQSDLKKMNSPEIPLPKINKKVEVVINSSENIAKRKEIQKKEIIKYRANTKLSEQEKNDTQAELEAKSNQEGIWNNIKAISKNAVNTVSDFAFKMTDEGSTPEDLKIDTDPFADEKKQAKEELKSNGNKNPNKEDIAVKAKEIYVDNINLEKKQQKINSYLESVAPETKSALKIDADERFTSLSKNKKEITNRISVNEKYFEQLKEDLKSENITDEDRNNLTNELNKTAKYLNSDYKKFTTTNDELGTAQDEFDAFKRNYNALDNTVSRAISSVANAGVSLYSGANYVANTLGANEEYKQEGIKEAKEFLQEKKEGFRPDNKEITLDNFFQYSTDLLANQTGTLSQVATGGIFGAALLGVEGAGDKYSEMFQAQKNGKNYTPAQMAITPFVSGLSTAILSELPTISTLRNSANVWRSALKETAGKELIDQAIKTTGKSIAKNIAKDTGKEMSTELADNIVQNAINRDILGDKKVGYFDNSIKTLKDTALLTGMIGATGAIPHVAISAVKTFTDKANVKAMDINAKKIAELSKQLDNENISEATKTVIKQQITKATKQSSEIINKTIDKMGEMPLEKIETVYENSKKISEIQQKADDVKEDFELDDVAKKTVLDGLKEEYKTLDDENTTIINETNEKAPPTPEAQPQAEVPQQAEAEKVGKNTVLNNDENGVKNVEIPNKINGLDESPNNEVSPVEDVVATSVENIKNNGLKISGVTSIEFEDNNETILYGTKNNKTRISIKGMSKEQIQEEYDFDKQVFDKNKNRDFESEEIEIKKSIGLTDNEKISALKELKSSKRYNDILENITLPFYETKLNEKPQEGDITPNASIRPTASNVGESGNAEPKTPAKESVSSSVDGGEVKGDVEVGKKSVTLPNLDDIADFINQTYLNDGKQENGQTAKRSDGKQGTTSEGVIKNSQEFQGETNSKEKRLKISQKGKTPLAKRKFKGDRAKANAVEPHDENTLVLQHFVSGGKISSDAVLEILKSDTEVKARNNSFNGIVNKSGKGIDALAHDLWESNSKLSISKIKDAIIDVVTSHNTVQDITNTILKNNDVQNEQSPEYHLVAQEAYYEAQEVLEASDEEMQVYENALEQFTEAEIIELAETQDLAYDDFIKDLKTREVTFDFGPFQNETGVIQSDGSIQNSKGEIFTKDNVSNVKQVNVKPEVILDSKKSISKDTPELKEVNAKLEKANENLRIAKDALDRKAKLLDKELLKDNEDIFGGRKNQNENKLFDERVDGNARKKATEKERNAIKQAQDEVKNLTEVKAKIESGEISSTKEIYFSKIDEIANVIKKATKADINPNDYDKNGFGFDQDKLIDLIAAAVKSLVSKGIDINEAIVQVVDSIKAKFGEIDIDVEAIKERINPKKEADNDFKSKSGKKSLLGRLIEGGNPDVITKAVKELGENYDVRNQQEANDEAMAFIDKVGASEALKAIKDGLITNSDVKMLIYDEAITRLKTEISDEMNNNPEDREALIKKFQEVSDDFDKAIRDAGQGIAIMNFIYNKNQTLKYNLTKQINDWKRNDPNGEIPADVKAKFEELEKKLKDVEERTKVAEERAKKAEDELAIKNIKEDVERKSQAARKNKSGLTPKEQSEKTTLRREFNGAFNDVSRVATLLADPKFRRYISLVFKQAKGDFYNFSNEILKDLGKSARQHLPELFKEAGGKGDVKVTDLQSITIRKDKKIKIPAQMLRDYVEQGYTDIDEIAALIKDDIADEFPDVDLRDIRDALTGYGKKINPKLDEISGEVNKLKEYGRLLSAYDDVMNGKMPLKSGFTREKPEQRARELRRKINRIAKELNIEPVDLEKQWANALDKVKSHLENQIEDLNKQIANGEKRKVDRTPTKLDKKAEELKATRDALKQQLDDLVGKPELTDEQKIANAEKLLETSIKKIQEEIDTNDIAFKEKPTAVTSAKIEQLKSTKKALLETKKQLRQEAGLIEQQRLKTTKTRIKNQIEDLNTRIKNKDFAKKEVKPILADNELNALRAEKEAVYEEYEKMKYLQELQNRTLTKKIIDEGMEALGLARAIKASLDLGLIGIQLRGFTYSELWRNPKELGRKFVKMFGAIGSQNKTNKAMSEIIGHPLHALAKKLDIGMTHPDLRNEVREEMASGNLLHFIWSSPVLAAEALGGKEAMNSKRTSIGDAFINAVKAQYNKLFKNYQVDIKQKEKFTIKEQWRNINAFEAVERGLSIYGNQLRFEEFVRGVERLRAEGKDEINHLDQYEALASAIRTFSGRANPNGFKMNQKFLNIFFFSFKNMVSVVQQLNPYYMLYELNKPNFKQGVYKPTVAGKMAMATMFKSVVSTSATLLFLIAAYNAFKDDDEEEATIEKDPRSSDFGKLKIGNFRYDPWGGYIPLITLYARLLKEEVKKADGTISKFGEDKFGIQNRGDAASRFLINKESPGFQMFHKYMTSTEEVDKTTGETYRATPFGGKLSEEDAYSFYPIFLGSVKSAKEKDYEGVKAFLTAYSILGLGNVQEYESKKGNTPEDKFIKKQQEIKEYNALPQEEKDKVDSNAKIPSLRGAITEQENMKYAIKTKTPYYVKGDSEPIDLSDITIAEIDETIADLKNSIEEMKKEAGDKYTEPKN